MKYLCQPTRILCLLGSLSFLSWQEPSSFLRNAQAFSVSKMAARTQSRSSVSLVLRASGSREDYENDKRYQQALRLNKLRTDVRIFLTQRAFQSFIFLLIECRDPHTVTWLENIYDLQNLEHYHGTGAFNLTRYDHWDAILMDMLQRPKAVVIVAARRRGRGHGGWSKNNPHLEERFVEFEINIEPPSLVSRLLSVRQQIAHEWVADLQTLVAVNELILQSYHETQDRQRAQEEHVTFDKEHTQEKDEKGEDANVDDADDGVSIEDLTAPYTGTSSSLPSISTSEHAYERKANEYLSNRMMEHEAQTGMPSSAQRKGNFDLLSLLATQEAVHVVLRQYMQQGDERRVSLEWLRNFYNDRLVRYFDGDGKYGRADDFLQDILLAPPSVVTDKNVMELVDPMRIAEDIIHARTTVALEWKGIMQHQVPSDHMELQQAILEVRMGNSLPSPEVATPEEEPFKVKGSVDIQEVFGEFE